LLVIAFTDANRFETIHRLRLASGEVMWVYIALHASC
jgi:hypothetical protein